ASWMCWISFSVVQKTTTGLSPPAARRSCRRKSRPFITGMFQSSSTTSGIFLRQASRASLPSAASSMTKCISSRMRRATFRTTRESSTMRQDFMSGYSGRRDAGSRRLGARGEVEHTGDVEHDKQALVEAIDAARDLAPHRVERRRVALRGFVAETQYFAHRVDHDAVEFAAVIDDHAHAMLTFGQRRQQQPRAQVYGSNDATAQIERAATSAGASGMRVMRCGPSTSCTCSTGMPKS